MGEQESRAVRTWVDLAAAHGVIEVQRSVDASVLGMLELIEAQRAEEEVSGG